MKLRVLILAGMAGLLSTNTAAGPTPVTAGELHYHCSQPTENTASRDKCHTYITGVVHGMQIGGATRYLEENKEKIEDWEIDTEFVEKVAKEEISICIPDPRGVSTLRRKLVSYIVTYDIAVNAPAAIVVWKMLKTNYGRC